LILRPSYILGPVPRPSATCMNLSLCLGIYAVLCRELGRPMRFLGPAAAWTALHNLSHSDRVAQLAVNGGAVLPTLALTKCMPLNASDRDAFSYEGLWPKLAAWAGCSWEGPTGRNGMRFTNAMGGQTLEALSEVWAGVANRHGLQSHGLAELLNVAFLDQSMSVGYNARLSPQKTNRLHWASPSRDGGWATLQRAFNDLASQGLLPARSTSD